MTNPTEYLDLYTEATPNPETMKFVFNKMILPGDSADFPSRDRTENSPLAKNLFEFSFVNGVFIMNNFVTITRTPGSDWNDINPILKEFLKAYIEAKEPVIMKTEVPVFADFGENNTVVEKINEILETYVKPAVENDGGQIVFKDFENGIVTLEMRGSCSGCPSSTITLKRGIEAMLTRMIPEVKEVIAEAM
ncbi:MAG: NifU family protein [Bacteroidia bacterium]